MYFLRKNKGVKCLVSLNIDLFVDFFKRRCTRAETEAERAAARRQAGIKKACRSIGKKDEKVLDFPQVYGMIEAGN